MYSESQQSNSECPATKKRWNDTLEEEMPEMSIMSEFDFFSLEGKSPQDIADWSRHATKEAFMASSSSLVGFHRQFCADSFIPALLLDIIPLPLQQKTT